ncbi:MAG TPA: DCC1-like thiol-disulfide oxidoreductase family protein [Fulvivirga sp.]|nr:DCC1-like thiol-disulfide oxidoreductase family protein [Fulvivirga sp.]
MGTSDQIKNPSGKHIIFFDGYCNLCNGAVNFIIDKDKKRRFLFASLQSQEARVILGNVNSNQFDTIIVLTSQGYKLERSSAALFIAKNLVGWPKILLVFRIFPNIFRDWLYNLIAKYRYSIFGKRNTCRVPTPDLKERFLDAYQNN